MKLFVKVMPLVFAAIMTACSNEKSVDEPSIPSDNRQLVTINVEQTAASRAGRVLESSEAGEKIDNVKVILTDQRNSVVWTHLYDNWSTGNDAVSWISADSRREAQIEIPKEEYRLEEGVKYNVYAVGYSNGSDYDLSALDASIGSIYGPTVSLPFNSGAGEEIFAGMCTIVGNPDGVNETLDLSRQVAGVYTYLCKIPLVRTASGYTGRYLQLIASNAQAELALGDFGFGENVAFDETPARTDKILVIDLKDWFYNMTEGIDSEGFPTGCIATGSNWKGDPAKYQEGAVYAGSFVLPFVKTTNATFKLLLTTDFAGENVLRSWNVLLPDDAEQLGSYTLSKYNGRSWSSATVSDTSKSYNVLRNHLYALGKHPHAAIIPNPENPDDEDQAIPINNKQDIMVRVNHNWSSIVILGIE